MCSNYAYLGTKDSADECGSYAYDPTSEFGGLCDGSGMIFYDDTDRNRCFCSRDSCAATEYHEDYSVYQCVLPSKSAMTFEEIGMPLKYGFAAIGVFSTLYVVYSFATRAFGKSYSRIEFSEEM